MTDRDVRERDILVASNEYAYVQDLTKGDIVLYVGPTKISLSNTERLVDYRSDRFVPVRSDDGSLGVSPLVAASSSQYIILENPPKDGTLRPIKGSNASIELLAGRKVVVPGPATFPLWPGQRAKVIDGHKLREREYLVVRVYDPSPGDERPIGTEIIVRGSDTSFYIPKTGLEVVPGEQGYVRKAWRLTKNTGLHVRIVKPYVAGEGDQLPPGIYAAGAEVFIHDREGFFFPTESLEVKGIVFALPIAEKEGIYVRDIETGRISTIAGPCSYLPDPTRVEVIERLLSPELAALYAVVGQLRGRALSIYIPPSYAVLVIAKNKREVVKGPVTRILAFDEDLEILRLSTGRPKSDEALLPTCFLQIEGNKVSDVVRVKTADHVELEVALSYRVSFVTRAAEGEHGERWFHVKNYVGLLCDHLGSILRAAARGAGIDAFHAASTELLRSAILGEKRGESPREGRMFEENGMWVYDVEVLDVKILDHEVKKLLEGAQRAGIVSEVNRRQEELRLTSQKLKEDVDRQIYSSQIETMHKQAELEAARRQLVLAQAGSAIEAHKVERVGKAANDAEAFVISTHARIAAAEQDASLDHRRLSAQVVAFKEQMAAIHPELVATLKTLGHQQLAGELSRNVSPLAILGGESVTQVVERLFGSLPLGASREEDVKKVLAIPKSKS